GQPRLPAVQDRRQGLPPVPGRRRGARPELGEERMSVAARRGGWRPTFRRSGRTVLAAVLVAGVAAAAWLLFAPGDDHDTKAANDAVPLGSAAAQRRDLIASEDVDGTL